MIKAGLMISLLSFVGFVYANSCSNTRAKNSNYQTFPKQEQIAPKETESVERESSLAKIISISDINKQKPTEGTFQTKGFIAKV